MPPGFHHLLRPPGCGILRRIPRTVLHTAGVPWLLATAALALGVACGGTAGHPSAPIPTPTPVPSPKVLIMSVDGLRADALQQSAVPNILSLARRGAFTWKAQTVFPSMTLPAHTSMLTGFAPTAHGITWDDYNPDKGNCTVPTVFEVAKAAGLRTVLVAGKQKFQHLNVGSAIDDFVLSPRGDAEIANLAIVEVQAGFDLMFVHFPDVDITGHAKGWLSADYLGKVTDADTAIGRLLLALPPETTVIFTSDHGGRGTNHGSSSPEDMTIPWIVAGPRIRAHGAELRRAVRTMDTAATALWVLGLREPSTASGGVVDEAFEIE